ncbi:60S ribosomal protein L9-like [Cucumis melo var. makuwa]|uniref:60S ribosomal protein L9-like n=1 Tax=Cucumis melo var. makuwa TaxID=1194695 RepID=A0A5A7V1X8_CUCMM|nr:60S ribosomal protein L9-like [Cucumis melo var. makuwa]TYK24768.1 60S ribosomal protein L9-like [Cucumis melo var. makuwa]
MLDGVSITQSEKVKDELVLDGNDIELVCRGLVLLLTRNVMSRTRIYGSSLMVSMLVRRKP